MKEDFSDSETQAGRLQRCAHKRDACAIEFYMALLKKIS